MLGLVLHCLDFSMLLFLTLLFVFFFFGSTTYEFEDHFGVCRILSVLAILIVFAILVVITVLVVYADLVVEY